jgi:hypothetical protein
MASDNTDAFEKISIDNMEPSLIREVKELAQDLFGNSKSKKIELVQWLVSTYFKAKEHNALVIHSPGGWGCSDLENLIDWERSVVDGVQQAIKQMGYHGTLVQYYRTRNNWWSHLLHIPEQARYSFTGKIFQAEVMAAEIKFLATRLKNLNIILLGVSQGAAFNNTVMKYLITESNVCSIELGTFFAQLPRRVITGRTLALDGNGLVLDPVVHRNLRAASRAYLFAPFRWINYKLAGKPEKFTYCINVPGHDYNWKYPEVNGQIVRFLQRNLKK